MLRRPATAFLLGGETPGNQTAEVYHAHFIYADTTEVDRSSMHKLLSFLFSAACLGALPLLSTLLSILGLSMLLFGYIEKFVFVAEERSDGAL